MARAKVREYMADFETTTDPNDCRVWSWAFVENKYFDEYVSKGLDIESFIRVIEKDDRIVNFHNLAFDGRFILDHLMKNGYKYTTGQNVEAGMFSALISDMGKFYTITVRFWNGNKVEFRDSLKKLNMSVDVIAKAFKHPAPKGEIDYTMPREVGYSPTSEEWDYIEKDVQIVADALGQLKDQGMTKLTVASSALNEYKTLIGKKQFLRLFPVLDQQIDDDIRSAYKGGYTYCDERFRGVIQGKGVTLDVNSLYPYVMRKKSLPFGTPVFFDGPPEYDEKMPLQIFSVTVTAKLKPKHIPIIQIKGGSMFNPVAYQTEINEPTRLTVTNIDWQLYNEHYDITPLQWHGGWKFNQAKGLFDKYVDKWMQVKETTTGGMREIAKLYLNSLYGKFGSNPLVGGKYPILDDNGVVQLKLLPEETKDPVYTAMAVFITAYAREHTIRAAQANYDTFAYCDTDSLHLLQDDLPDLDIHPTKIGAWKHEYNFKRALFLGPKKYLEHTEDGKHENHIAGVPVRAMAQLRMDYVYSGMKIAGKLHPKYVPGGVALEDVVYTLKY